MDPIGTERLNSNCTVYTSNGVKTISLAVSKKAPEPTTSDKLNKNNINISGSVPVNKQIIFFDLDKVSKNNKAAGLIKIDENVTDTAKGIMSGAAIAADGAGAIMEKFDFIKVSNIDALNVFHWGILNGVDLNFLDGIDVLGVQSLKVTATALRLGVNYKDLRHDIKNKDSRNSAWDILSMSKGTWALVVGGFKTAEASTALGANVGVNSAQTAASLGAKATNLSNMDLKVAIPLAVANTGLELWDLLEDNKKVTNKEKELKTIVVENNLSPQNSKVNDVKAKKIKEEIGILQTNSQIMGASLGFSALSTGALISSVVFQAGAKYTTPVFMVGNVLASVSRTLSDNNVRNSIVNTYNQVQLTYGLINYQVSKFLVR